VSTESLALTGSPRIAWWKALLLIVPIAAWAGLMTLMPGDELIWNIGGWATWLVFVSLFFLILVTGRTNRYRSILFILIAVLMPVNFIAAMLERHGTMALSQADFLDAGAAFCPLALPMLIVPAAFTKTVIFPSVLLGTSGIIGMSSILLASSLATGRGWCSWGCFYGGWDEFFSRLLKKPVIRKIDRRWIYLPFGVLLAVVLTSAFTLTITYCEWICPFKVLTEFAAPTSPLIIVQTVLFVLAFVGLVVVLPLLTKKRVQCALFCPLGALQSFWNKINIFEVRIDRGKCGECNRCIRECPTLSLSEESLRTGKPSITCTRCGKCIDACTKGAISFHVKGTRLGVKPNVARVLFLYPSWILMATLGGSIVQAGLWRILRLVTTGSMLR
jgi:ferredoxin-type protein NapH